MLLLPVPPQAHYRILSRVQSYDPLSRLSTALTNGSTNYPQWGLSWGYDLYGNRLNQTLTAGSGYQGSVQVTASSNRINCIGGSGQSCSGGVVPTYDANGNMTYDGMNTLVYDTENRAASSSGTLGSGNYTYDGNGNRVQKVSGATTTVYIFSGSKVIAEYDNGVPPAGPTREYVYAGGTLLSRMGSIDVRFTNDSCSACGGNPVGGGDRNLFINSITAGSTVIPPNDPSVSYTVPSCNGNGGLYCSGDMITTASVAESAQTITVNAYGSPDYNIYPHMQLLVGGNIVGQWDVTGTAQNYTVTLQSTATQYFSRDHLSNRMVIDSAGNIVEQMGHYPFGDPWYNATNDKLYFTTYERDAESGNDYAMARYYAWRIGRFLSVDQIAGSTSDPQSLNGFDYTENDPINLSDPSGQCPSWGPFPNNCGSADTHVIDPYATLPGITYVDITLGPPILYLNVDSNGAYQFSQNYDQELSVAEFGNIYATVFSLVSSGGGNFTFDFLAGAALRENFKAFLKSGISQDCINALTGAFGPNALDQLAQAIDSTTFFNVNALSPQPVANYWGSGNGPMTLGNAFTSRGSGAVTKTGSSDRGYQPGIYTWNGTSTFADSPYFLLHEVTHVLQGSLGVPGNLDVASVNQFGLAVTNSSPNAASNAVSKFFNNKCAGYNQ